MEIFDLWWWEYSYGSGKDWWQEQCEMEIFDLWWWEYSYGNGEDSRWEQFQTETLGISRKGSGGTIPTRKQKCGGGNTPYLEGGEPPKKINL